MPQNKLDIQATPESTAFYIEGSLQFDTRDEFIYHETLVIPAASLLSARVTRPANALVLGGGDGLALRELLKFDMFRRIDLVDYDPEVIRCGKTTFAPWNRDALYDSKVRVIVDEAQRYLHTSRKVYDLIVADFTFPDNLAASQLFTTAFYDLIKKRLSSKGFVTLNAISPETSSPAYWSIFKTLASLKLHPIPLRAKIPSFISHGYGEWGFFLSSPSPVLSRELKRFRLSVPSRYLTKESLLEGMRFSKTGTALGLSLATVLSEPSDLLCFLNMPVQAAADHGEQIDFSKRLSAKDLRALGIQYDLIASGMTAEWCERLIKVWLELDWEALLSETEKNIKKGWDKLQDEFSTLKKELPEMLRSKDFHLDNLCRSMALLLVLIIFMNTIYPDNAYAKGYYGGHSGTGGTDQGPQLAWMAPVAAAAFYGLGDDLAVVDVKGGKHIPKNVMLFDEHGIVKRKRPLAAIADDLYISEAGDVWQTLPGLPYYYQIMNDRYVLFEEGVETSIFEFPPDPLAERTLRNNLEIQSKALERTLKDHEAWLEWAGPAQYVSKDIRNEIREMKKLKVLQAVFAELKAQKSQANSLVNTEVTASVPCLVPGVCLTKSGRILLRQKRDAQIRYVAYAGLLGIQGSTLTEEDGLAVSETIPADERLTRFLKLVLQNKVNKTKPGGSRAFSSSW